MFLMPSMSRTLRPQPDVSLSTAPCRSCAAPAASGLGCVISTRRRARAPASCFNDFDPTACAGARDRARVVRLPSVWRRLMLNGMREDFSWDTRVAEYERLYAES